MKKIMMSILAGVSILSACQQTPGYKVTGTILGAEEGDTVRIVQFKGWDIVTLQETLMRKDGFTFTGRKDTADFYYISYIKNGLPAGSTQFILENGNIHIKMDPNVFTYDIKGTPINETWCAFHNENERLCEKTMAFYHALNDTVHPLDSITAKQKQAEMEALDKKINDYRLQVCRENIQNPIGVYCLLAYMKGFDNQTVEELLDQIPTIYQTEEVAAIKQGIANKKKTQVGEPFIDFTLKTPEGENLSIAEVANANKITLIDFWASWCGPCRAEMPSVKASYEKYHEKGFEIIGVSLDNDEEAWKKAISTLELKWPQVSDLKGWECEGAALYGVRSIPATFLIQNGKIVARDFRAEELEELLKEML